MSISTPVAFLIYNRPDLTKIVFQEIAKAKPRKLFVIADGPRFPEEEEKCIKARAIIDNVNWDCEVLTNFSEINLGCGLRESSGFDWVFSQVEEAIFLEDDTLPAPSFFNFCESLLEYYRHDERIMHINGANSLAQNRNEHSYYFSKYMHGWGWASWRRAWKHYDYYMRTWPEFKSAGLLDYVCVDRYEIKYWTKTFDSMYENPQIIDTWDYQWTYACFSQSGLIIAPNQNLISNLGFNRADAAHTKGDHAFAELPTKDIWEIKHPKLIVKDREADKNTFDQIYGGNLMRKLDTPIGKLHHFLYVTKNKVKSNL